MPDGMRVILTIVERGRGAAMIRLYTKHQVFLHCQFPGRGTATSEIMDILGLGSSEKDVVLSYTTAPAAARLLRQLDSDLRGSVSAGGIAFSLPLSALNSLAAAAIAYQTEPDRKGETTMDSEQSVKSTLILITCARGCTEAVMDTAKKAGARGGTVIKARWTGLQDLEESYGLKLQPEREIVAIVVPDELRRGVMESVNAAHGLRSDSQAMLCSLPIEQLVRL